MFTKSRWSQVQFLLFLCIFSRKFGQIIVLRPTLGLPAVHPPPRGLKFSQFHTNFGKCSQNCMLAPLESTGETCIRPCLPSVVFGWILKRKISISLTFWILCYSGFKIQQKQRRKKNRKNCAEYQKFNFHSGAISCGKNCRFIFFQKKIGIVLLHRPVAIVTCVLVVAGAETLNMQPFPPRVAIVSSLIICNYREKYLQIFQECSEIFVRYIYLFLFSSLYSLDKIWNKIILYFP